MSPLPLAGITVIALEQAVAVPFATRQLADLGARVIKIERPDVGDFARGYDTTVHGLASHFVWLNRSKESLTLDLKRPEARDVLARLIARADVFVQNLAPGAADRLGLGAEALRAQHPRLIVCGLTGYGSTGPVRREEGLRPARAERGRPAVDHGHAGHAVEGRPVDRRHRRRHVRVLRHPDGAAPAPSDRSRARRSRSRCSRRSASGWGTRCTTRWAGRRPRGRVRATRRSPRTGRTRRATVRSSSAFRTTVNGRRLPLACSSGRNSRLTSVFRATTCGFSTARPWMPKSIGPSAMLSTTEVVSRLDAAQIANARLNSVEQFIDHPQLAGRAGVAAGGLAERPDTRTCPAGPPGWRRARDGSDSRPRSALGRNPGRARLRRRHHRALAARARNLAGRPDAIELDIVRSSDLID